MSIRTRLSLMMWQLALIVVALVAYDPGVLGTIIISLNAIAFVMTFVSIILSLYGRD